MKADMMEVGWSELGESAVVGWSRRWKVGGRLMCSDRGR
jgi:hypothetical protein